MVDINLEGVMDILVELTDEPEIRVNPDIMLFEEELIDSFGTIQLIMKIEEKLGVSVPVSAFDRDEWATPNMMLERIKEFAE